VNDHSIEKLPDSAALANCLSRRPNHVVSKTVFVDDFNVIRYVIGRNDEPINGNGPWSG
jgi:hypothetical protein